MTARAITRSNLALPGRFKGSTDTTTAPSGGKIAAWYESASSVSFIAQLPEDERAALLERVRNLAPPGEFDFPYLTKVFTARPRSLRQNRLP